LADAAAVRRIATFKASQEAHVSKQIVMDIPCDPSRRWYQLEGSEDSDKDHGMLAILLSAPIANLNGEIAFSIHLRWSVLFDGPDIPEAEAGGDHIYADSSYTPYFTDSSNDWQGGKKLSLKATEGGSLVPFAEAEPGKLYVLDKKAQLQYYESSSKLSWIRYGVRARDFNQYPILAVFAEEAQAKAYIQTGDVANLLDYVSAGPWVTPSNPVWVAGSKATVLYTNRRNPAPQLLVPHRPLSEADRDRKVSIPQSLSDRFEELTIPENE
jgi:hypothetical protein